MKMTEGFLRVATGTFDITTGAAEKNAQKAASLISQAGRLGVNLLVLPELCTTGSCCGALFHNRVLLDAAKRAESELIAATSGFDTLVAFGTMQEIDGTPASTIVIAQNGKKIEQFPSADGCNVLCSENGEVSIGFAFCEQLMAGALPAADVVCVLSSMPATADSFDDINSALKHTAKLRDCTLLLASSAGDSTTDDIYDGQYAVVSPRELLIGGTTLFEARLAVCDVDIAAQSAKYVAARQAFCIKELEITNCVVSPVSWNYEKARCIRALELQAQALARRLKHIGGKGFVLGVSGGLDSSLALLCSIRAAEMLSLDRKAVLGISMPGFGTSGMTKGNSDLLMDALGISHEMIPIGGSVLKHFEDISHDPNNHNVAYENAQARERTQILLDIANDRQFLNVGTGDLSEEFLGFCTYGGDGLSMYNVNASISKTFMRQIINAAREVFPEAEKPLADILATPVSPELLPTDGKEIIQRTEDIVGPYDLQDFYIYYFVKFGMTPEQLYQRAHIAFDGVYDDAMLKDRLKVLFSRFFSNQFKRNSAPEGASVTDVTVSSRSFALAGDMAGDEWLRRIEAL